MLLKVVQGEEHEQSDKSYRWQVAPVPAGIKFRIGRYLQKLFLIEYMSKMIIKLSLFYLCFIYVSCSVPTFLESGL